MIITRTPLRISIGGGGTDLPSYYRRRGGRLVSAAINRYVYISINHTFTDDYLLKYSTIERVGAVDEIDHDILRTALGLHRVPPGVEIVSMADIPAGTGLGSSGSFTVGLLRALYAHRHESVMTDALAEQACAIEIDHLKEPVGKQDQYIAAYGGLTAFEFHADDRVEAERLAVGDDTMCDLEEHLLLFFTGYSRAASAMLADQDRRSADADEEMLANLDRTKALGDEIAGALVAGETATFGELMHEHWVAKRARTSGMSNPDIDRYYDVARAAGALGGKVVGAGAGGFLMVYAPEPNRVRRAMRAEGLGELRFRFDHLGSTVLTAG
ncbi:MAG: galactokinase [Microthrixaceae bacterium]